MKVYVRLIRAKKDREWLGDLKYDEFFRNITSTSKTDYWPDPVWKCKPKHEMQFENGSRYHFVCSANAESLDDVVDCVVWVPFQGRTRSWVPKSIHIRQLTDILMTTPKVGYIDDISEPLYTFYYNGKISLMDNYYLRSSKVVIHKDNCEARVGHLGELPFNDKLIKAFISHNYWLGSYIVRSESFFTRSARLLTALMTITVGLCLNTVYLEHLKAETILEFGLMRLPLKVLFLQLGTGLVVLMLREIYKRLYVILRQFRYDKFTMFSLTCLPNNT